MQRRKMFIGLSNPVKKNILTFKCYIMAAQSTNHKETKIENDWIKIDTTGIGAGKW